MENEDPTSPAPVAETTLQEVEGAVKTEASEIVADAKADFTAAVVWLKAEWDKIEPVVLNELGAAIEAAVTDAEEGEGLGEIVADVLDRIENSGSTDVKLISSDVITASTALKVSAP